MSVRPPGDGKSPNSPCKGVALYQHGSINFIDLHYTAFSKYTPEKIASMKENTSKGMWDREMERDADAIDSELVFGSYSEAIHVVKESEVPGEGCIFMGIDPHIRTPHAMLWLLVDKEGDYWFYRELWPSVLYGEVRKLEENEVEHQFFIKQYCNAVAHLEGSRFILSDDGHGKESALIEPGTTGERIAYRFMDTSGKGFKASSDTPDEETFAKRYKKFGIRCLDPIKAKQTGFDRIKELLEPRPNSLTGTSPRLHIVDKLWETRAELLNYRYAPTANISWKDENQNPSEFRCHMIDLMRYLVTSPRVQYVEHLVSERFRGTM